MARDWEKEIEKNKQETEKDPEDANAWYNLGWANIQSVGAKIQSGNLDAECNRKIPVAEAALKKAIELCPEHGRAHVLLSQLYRYIKRYDDAIEQAKVGLGLPPGSDDWFAAAETVASCYMLKEDMPHSIEYLEIIKEQRPNDPMTIFKRACCYWQVGNLDAAEEEFEHLTKIPGGNPNAPSCLAQVRAAQAKRGAKKEAPKPAKVEEPIKTVPVQAEEPPKKVKEAPKPAPKEEEPPKKVKEPPKGPTKAEENAKKVQDAQAKAQELGKKLTEDIQKVMASNMPAEKKGAEVTRLQKEFNEKLSALMKN